VLRQPLVQERVVGAQQIERAAIFADDAVEEELGFAAERLAQAVIEVREDALHRHGRVEIAKEEPLPCEIGHEGVCARFGQHAADFARQQPPVWTTARARRDRASCHQGCCSTE
jgi:hypothetical protein